MDHVTVEDFQTHHDRDSLLPSLAENSSPSREHEDDMDPFSSPSPTAHHGSPPNEPIFDVPSHSSSPDTSPQHSDDDISVLLSDYQNGSRTASQQQHQQHPSSPYTPLKDRPSGFRNPSSVRALQDTTPPHYHLASPLSNKSKNYNGSYFPTPSRKGTPRSSQRSPSKLSPAKKIAAKKEYPLVLLHVTMLPIPTTYTKDVMERVLPPHILRNWKLLREKVTATVLERGILIPHPREDYDLLEERLLESLELRMPRILACGHFHLDADEEAEILAAGEEIDDEDNDADICTDCGRRVRDGRYGAGTGNRRWDIKLFAANGLMRAGAWGAAWREMERVDVEICPWVGEELQRELESAREAEDQENDLRRATEEDAQETGLEDEVHNEEGPSGSGLDNDRMREIYGDGAQAYLDGLQSASSPETSPQRSVPSNFPQQPSPNEFPLSTLLVNYLTLLAQDRRNVAIALLSILVLALTISSKPTSEQASILSPSRDYVPQAPSMAAHASSTLPKISSSVSSILPPASTEAAGLENEREEPSKGVEQSEMAVPFTEENLEAKFEFD